MEIYEKDGIEYITHKSALKYYGCTPATIKNWRESGRLKYIDLPLDSGRLYARDKDLREYHLGGERFDNNRQRR